MDDLGWSSHIRREEDVNYWACIEAAKKDAHTMREAENCEAGALKCKTCPFKKKFNRRDKTC